MNETLYSKDEAGQWWAQVHNADGSVRQRLRCKPRNCATCGDEFVRLYANKYCSRPCTSRAMSEAKLAARQKQTCENCGEEFWNRHIQKYCVKKCRYKFETGKCRKKEPPRTCPICETVYERKSRRPWRKTCGDTKCVRALAEQHPGYLPRMCGADNPNWTGGKRLQTKAGYIMVYAGPGAPSRLEHRVVMEEMLGRPLERFEEVHHRNAVRNDNRPENLELWVKRQPGGSRAKDLIEYAHWILETYGPVEDKL